jgi:AcrR family transcriptional regulator
MSASHRTEATERLREHLAGYDWSAQSAGRRAALEAFLRLANKHGFNAVTMRSLARELEIKAPSLYAHFPNGRDEIVAEALRWHFARFGEGLLAAVDAVDTADEFWDTMVRVHLVQQIEVPESNLWDLLVATDSIVHFLPAELRKDVDLWNGLYEDMYIATVEDMGLDVDEDNIRIALAVLEQATRWCDPDRIDSDVAKAVQVTRALIRLPAPAALPS